jgi:4-amino-4-deoxy-L-arabinose transferase-like glycosyltransferase
MSLEPGNLSALFLMLALLLSFALPLNALLRHTRRPAYFIGIFLLAYAEMVFIAQAAHFLHAVRLNVFVLLGILFSGISIFAWIKKGKPSLRGPLAGRPLRLPPFRADYALWILGVGVSLAMLVVGLVIFLTPPNNYDSMTYHLSRVGYWLQHQNLAPWDTPNIRQTTFPVNEELGILWTIMFGGSDRYAGFVQWTAALVSFLSVVGMARTLGASARKSLFAGFIVFTFPLVLLQSGTTQNDLLAGAFAGSCVYLLYLGIVQRRVQLLLLSALALGLALGTKITVFLTLPGLAILVALLWIKQGRQATKPVLLWGGLCVAAFLLIGSFTYIQNFVYYGNPVSTSEVVGPVLSRSNQSRLKTAIRNMFLYGYQWVDVTGIPQPAAASLSQLKIQVANTVIRRFHLVILPSLSSDEQVIPETLYNSQPHEDSSWFGLLGAFLLVLAGILAIWNAIRQRQVIYILPLIYFLSFFGAFSFLMGWTAYQGRYLALPVVIYAPLLGWIYPEKIRLGWLRIVICIAGLLIASVTLANNVLKPLIGPNAIWKLDPMVVRTLAVPDQRSVIETVQRYIPENGAIATLLGVDDWDTPLFGETFQRRVFQLDPADKDIRGATLQKMGLEYLLVSPIGRTFLGLPEGLRLVEQLPNDWMLFQATENASEPLTPEQKVKLLGNAGANNLFRLSDDLVGKVGLIQIRPIAPWSIEEYQGQGFFWLGSGKSEGLMLRIYSTVPDELPLFLELQIAPGPARADPTRTLTVLFENRTGFTIFGKVSQTFPFQAQSLLRVPLNILPGNNEITLSINEPAQISPLPNGDTRPLMAHLGLIRLATQAK